MDSGRPYTTTFHVGETLESYQKVRAIAASSDHIVPGHDPLVMRLYPAPRADLDGIVVRLDLPPNRPRPAR
jgi:glyoxylase-like metal-dependent hydrolase (beta-lactamase superfamily II)